MAETDSEKTEEPTPERRRKAREEGQFPRAKDAGNTLASIAVFLTLMMLGETLLDVLAQFSRECFGTPYQLVSGDPTLLARSVGRAVVSLTFPIAFSAAAGALALGFAEAGYNPSMKLAAPKWERLNPLPKLKQMFMPHEAAMNVGLSLLRVAAVGAVAFLCVKGAFETLLHLARVEVAAGALLVLESVMALCLWASLALAVLAAVDFLKSYRQHENSIRMSRQELKDELKQQQGDPRVKQRQRARAREMVRRGLPNAVKSSDFVIANPTHVSVAVRYRAAEGAPVVTARGYDEVALYIRKLAKLHNIPVIENVALARALAERVKPGRQVPVDLYAAVAEVLAFVYRLQNRKLESIVGDRARD